MLDSEIIKKRAHEWLSPLFDEKTRTLVKDLLENNQAELEESFYKELDFGTGGLRGLMGVGTNRINEYTIAMATQGLANYLKMSFPGQKISVAIAYDSRNNSAKYAIKVSEILSANGIEAYRFNELRPTPQLSFAIRKFKCNAGIVITASHNPKEYNGYKVYWSDGGQLIPPHDKNIINEVRKIGSLKDVKQVTITNKLKIIQDDFDHVYHDAVLDQMTFPKILSKSDLQVVYTPIHGTGITAIPQVLTKAGLKHLYLVDAQSRPDGSFPTVKYPNPEEESAMKMGLQLAIEKNADLLLGTDPDSDRVGVGINNGNEGFDLINGNQVAAIIVYFLLKQLNDEKKLNGNEYIAKTIVTTPLINAICESYNVNCYDTLTGFKYIAEQIKLREKQEKFIAGAEESYGYLIGDYCRDKDAVVSSLIICEIAAWAKEHGKSIKDILIEIYLKYGFYKECLVSLTKQGRRGVQEIEQMMDQFRNNPKKTVCGKELLKSRDYRESIEKSYVSGNISMINLPKSNVIQLLYEDGFNITIRPSGTEPKIKFYLGVKTNLLDKNAFQQTDDLLNAQLRTMIKEFEIE